MEIVYKKVSCTEWQLDLPSGFHTFFNSIAMLFLYGTLHSIKNGHVDLSATIKEYMVFSFATFGLAEPFGLAPDILKRRKCWVITTVDHEEIC